MGTITTDMEARTNKHKSFMLLEDFMIFYHIILLIMFLFIVVFTKSLDLALPLYILLSALPFVSTLNTLPDRFCFSFYFICTCYLIIGILFQDIIASFNCFCTRYYQFMVLMWFLYNKRFCNISFHIKQIIPIAVVAEIILAGITLMSGGMKSENGFIRTVAGNQPVGGNLCIVLIPLLIWGYYHEKDSRHFVIVSSVIMAMFIVLSQTRGYLLMYVVTFLPIYIHYWLIAEQSRKNAIMKTLIVLVLATVFLLLLLIFGTEILEQLSDFLRLSSGTGRRDKENMIALKTFFETDLRHQLLGMGFGGTSSNVPGYKQAVRSAWGDSWGYYRYINMKGISFHNLYGNILLIQGIMGILFILLVFLWGIGRILNCNRASAMERFTLIMYWFGFFVMNYFRWSCDCGIAEMIMLAIVINKLTSVHTFRDDIYDTNTSKQQA